MIPKDLNNKEAVLNFLRTKTDRPVNLKEIAKTLGIYKKEMRPLKRIMESLIKSGDIFKTRSGFYGLADKMNLVTGSFEAHRDGYGFLIPDKSGERDLFIPPRKTSGAMSGDRVVARIESMARREGSIIKILERAQKKIVGMCYREGDIFYVKPKSRKIPFGILVSPGNKSGAKDGDNVVIELTSYPTAIKPAEGRVLKILTDITEPADEIDTIIEEYSLSRKFPSAVLSEVKELTGEISLQKRINCRSLLTVTIDGETAKDFDDAVSIKKTNDGFILFVHIADVSHYVLWDSVIDLEARRRGTSVYFPGNVVPDAA
ncbi:MAG: RNB domain-containing ribonuclease [Nitrospirae bacterium]|nr:RNB domain-containing ribonuclease [Nitrospirota bacterium]